MVYLARDLLFNMSIRYRASLMTAARQSSTTASAPGIWRISDVLVQYAAALWPTANPSKTQQAIFGFGRDPSLYNITNLVSNTGVVAGDTAGVGTARWGLTGATYGGDKGIFAYGNSNVSGLTMVAYSNLVSNTGVVATDGSSVGTARYYPGAANYGGDKAIFAYGRTAVTGTTWVSVKNLVSNVGVVAADVAGVGTARFSLAAASFGLTGQCIFAYGNAAAGNVSMSNLVSNAGVVASDVTGVGTARQYLAAANYNGDKAIFGYGVAGTFTAITNLVSTTGVVATDTTGVGTARSALAAAIYGGGNAIFAYGGNSGAPASLSNLVSNTGVVATDTSIAGTSRTDLCAAGFSFT